MSVDTICALATAPGGALGIIRISGPQALEILSHVFSKNLTDAKPNTVHFGHIKDGTEVIDEVLVSVFRAPHSYTGEDSAEISCHGSRYILNKVLELLIQQGCRIRGGISTKLSQLRDQLLKLTSLLELELDFSDHEDLEFADRSELLSLAKNINNHITHLAESFETGQAIKQGIPVAIVGKTNVGKSTLLNALLKDDRAIVSDIHGTTRDTIEDTIDINGITFRFIDTAGIRQTSDQVEQIGIERTYAAIDKARIVIWMVDAEPAQEELINMNKLSENKKLILVRNKIDKAQNTPFTIVKIPLIEISAKHGTHLSNLEQAIYEAADIPTPQQSDIIVTNARHYDALIRAHAHLQRVLDGMAQNISGDLLSEDLRLTLDTLSEITGGQITPNEVLGNIFKNFCVGK